ncbi:MAG: type II toxin-antitoxin system prevent-host-death family antitoxin [Prevotellaceae bacterium]|jgi:antitoxin YefM|nr:type II toxin-antitoxin system prevent-host-death family antitoxin [Prevotellaceae bacterium]
MRTVSYTDLRKNLKSYLDMVVTDSDTLAVHRPGNAGVVVISMDEYNAMSETKYLTSSAAMMKRLRSAEAHMKAGKGVKVNVNEL